MDKRNISEAWDQEDDWRGVQDAKERRRRQNRVHQRAHRKKRRVFPNSLGPVAGRSEAANTDTELSTAIVSRADEHQVMTSRSGTLVIPPFVRHLPDFLAFISCTILSQQVQSFLDGAYQHWSLSRPVSRDLPTLSRLNAFDALIRNAYILRIPVEALSSDEENSPLLLSGGRLPPGDGQRHFPAHLSPTNLQREVVHHSWLDLFPFPGLRDRILQGIQSGVLDEDFVCSEFCCELLNLESTSESPVIVWGDSWDASGWEFSKEFIERWYILLQGCPEILTATNHWRRLRGDRTVDLTRDGRGGNVKFAQQN